jgi:hypothetical protein
MRRPAAAASAAGSCCCDAIAARCAPQLLRACCSKQRARRCSAARLMWAPDHRERCCCSAVVAAAPRRLRAAGPGSMSSSGIVAHSATRVCALLDRPWRSERKYTLFSPRPQPQPLLLAMSPPLLYPPSASGSLPQPGSSLLVWSTWHHGVRKTEQLFAASLPCPARCTRAVTARNAAAAAATAAGATAAAAAAASAASALLRSSLIAVAHFDELGFVAAAS